MAASQTNPAINVQDAPQPTPLYAGRKAPHTLHVLIIGCGMGGLAAAHAVSVCDGKYVLRWADEPR